MPDASDKLRAFFDKLFRLVPGYGGYAELESRRDTDKLLREHLARQLGEAKGGFDRFTADLTRAPGGLELMNPAGSVTKLLEKLIDRLRFADYGYAGFFDSQKVGEPQLQAMYDFDLSLAQSIEGIKARVAALKPEADELHSLLSALYEFDGRLNARHDAIADAGKPDAEPKLGL
jgi:hypothetical protein